MGSPLVQMPEFAQDYKSGPAARGFKSGPIITVPGGYPDVVWHMGFNYEVANSDEAQAAVTDLVNRGADVIKIALEPGGEGYRWPMLDLAQVQAIVQEAHAHGKLVAHTVNPGDGSLASCSTAVDAIEHAPALFQQVKPMLSSMQPALYDASADKDIGPTGAQHIMVPTLTAYEPLCQSSDLTPEHKQECYQFIEGPVRVFHALGGTVALGNDYGAGDAVVGGMPLREMQLLLASGLTPMDVIEAGTRNAARVCGHGDELGTLEPDKLADVIIVDGDPLVDIEALSKVVVVIKGGLVVYPE
jgi:imidazolonepropionase-like amidohydrolase